MYQDVHVMMLVGFGFLMTFLKRYGLSSVGFNFLLTCFVIQWSLLVNGWFESFNNDQRQISLNLLRLVKIDFTKKTFFYHFICISNCYLAKSTEKSCTQSYF